MEKHETTTKKMGMNLLVKILTATLIPLIILVVLAAISINSVGKEVSEALIHHELRATIYAVETELDMVGLGDFVYDGTDLYRGDYCFTKNQEFLDDFKVQTGVDVTIFWDKIRVVTSIKDASGKRILGTAISDSVYQEVMENGTCLVDDLVIEGIDYYGYYEPFYQPDGSVAGIVFTGMQASVAEDIYTSLLARYSVIMVVIAIIAIVLLVVMVVMIVKAIEAMIYNVDKLADGELNIKLSDKMVNRSDEIGNIARAIHRLISSLVGMVNNIHGSAERLNDFSGKFQSNFNIINSSISNVNIAIDEIANGATSQANEMQRVNNQMNDMGEAIVEMSRNIDTLAASSDEMKNHNDNVSKTLDELMDISARTKESVDEVYSQTNVTNSSAMDIRSAIDIITDIASQTNLLSLNASIEAARAGEHGRGFAVVADEIRQLADQSRESAVRISEIVENLIKNSNISVETMNNVLEEINNQNEMLRVTKDVFGQLGNEVNSVSIAIDNITGQVDSLNSAKNDVLGSVESLAAIAEENAASTQETSASMVELGQVVNDCSEATQQLVVIAGELDDNVKQFKVD